MSDDGTPRQTRRDFCAGACHVASGAALAALVAACSGGGGSPTAPGGGGGGGGGGGVGSLSVLSGTAAGGQVRVTASGPLASVGGAARVDSTAGSFLVARTGAQTFAALTAVCTHEGCTVTGLDGTVYVCPCHGSRYNTSGQVLVGPAPTALQAFATSFAGGVVTITL